MRGRNFPWFFLSVFVLFFNFQESLWWFSVEGVDCWWLCEGKKLTMLKCYFYILDDDECTNVLLCLCGISLYYIL